MATAISISSYNGNDSNHGLPTYPNMVKEVIPTRPNQVWVKVWVSDITYMVLGAEKKSEEYKFCYLSLITDYYSKEIVGWCVGETLEAKFAIEALKMAIGRLVHIIYTSLRREL